MFSNWLYNRVEKRMADMHSGSVRFPSIYATENNILESSDVYELLQDISNQLMLAEIIVEDEDSNEIRNDPALKILHNPNNYLTQSEFIKLMTNNYLLTGEVFPLLMDNELHLLSDVEVELSGDLKQYFKVGDVDISSKYIRHIKNIGTSHLTGVGLLDLGRSTLEGVMNAEK